MDVASKTKNLQERDGRFYARLAVPAKLKEIVGKRELLEKLGPDRRTALRKLPGVIAKMLSTLDAARLQTIAKAEPAKPRYGQILNEHQIARTYYESELFSDSEDRDAGNVRVRANSLFIKHNSKDWVESLNSIVAGLADDNTIEAMLCPIFDKLAASGHFNADVGSPEWRKLARVLAGVQTEIIERQAERNQGDLTGKPRHKLLTEPEPEPSDRLARRILGPESIKPLSELLPAFFKERNISGGNENEHEVSVRMFEEHLGEPTPLYKITRRDVLAYKAALLELPANYVKRFPDTKLPDAIIANKKRKVPYPFLAPRTVNDKWLSALRAFLNWCVQNDLIPDSPANGVKVSYQVDKGTPPRVNFDPSDLAKIFSKPLFDRLKPWGETQWAYLVSLYCGTRPSELAQVKLDSIRYEREILIMRIQEQTKNTGSQRSIPIHSELVRLGFADYVAALSMSGASHLFPKWYSDGMKALERAEVKSRLTGKKAILNHHFPKFLPKRFNQTYLPRQGENHGQAQGLLRLPPHLQDGTGTGGRFERHSR